MLQHEMKREKAQHTQRLGPGSFPSQQCPSARISRAGDPVGSRRIGDRNRRCRVQRIVSSEMEGRASRVPLKERVEES